MIDLDVTNLADRVYALQRDVEEQPAPDAVSHYDWRAVQMAVRDLYSIVLAKLEQEKP